MFGLLELSILICRQCYPIGPNVHSVRVCVLSLLDAVSF